MARPGRAEARQRCSIAQRVRPSGRLFQAIPGTVPGRLGAPCNTALRFYTVVAFCSLFFTVLRGFKICHFVPCSCLYLTNFKLSPSFRRHCSNFAFSREGYAYDPECVYINGTGRDYYEFYIQLNRCGTLGKNSLGEDSRKNPTVSSSTKTAAGRPATPVAGSTARPTPLALLCSLSTFHSP